MTGRFKLWRNAHNPMGVLLGACAVLSVVAYLVATALADRSARSELAVHASEILDLHAKTITSHLDKYRHLPALLARRPDIKAMAAAALAGREVPGNERIALQTRALAGALDLTFVDLAGNVVLSARGFVQPSLSVGHPLMSLSARSACSSKA